MDAIEWIVWQDGFKWGLGSGLFVGIATGYLFYYILSGLKDMKE